MDGLEVSDDATWLETFGVEPVVEAVSGDELVREVRVQARGTDELFVTWDVIHGSVRVQYLRAGSAVVELYREQATLLRVETTTSETSIIVEYDSAEARGRTRIQMWPETSFTDTFMRT